MKLDEMKFDQQKELTELLEAWLSQYVEDVVVRVMNRLDEIVSNDMTMMMLRELKARQDKEKDERLLSLKMMIYDKQEGKDIENAGLFHSHCLTHSESYRDILYDLYIRE